MSGYRYYLTEEARLNSRGPILHVSIEDHKSETRDALRINRISSCIIDTLTRMRVHDATMDFPYKLLEKELESLVDSAKKMPFEYIGP